MSNPDYNLMSEYYDNIPSCRERNAVACYVEAAVDSGGPVPELAYDES